jgi:hypothetical protein
MPFSNVRTPDVPNLVRDGLRLQKPEVCSDGIFSIISLCWQVNPKARPNFEGIVRQLATQLGVHGMPPSRDIGAVLHSEKGQTLKRGSAIFAPQSIASVIPEPGRARVNSFTRSNPLFETQESGKSELALLESALADSDEDESSTDVVSAKPPMPLPAVVAQALPHTYANVPTRPVSSQSSVRQSPLHSSSGPISASASPTPSAPIATSNQTARQPSVMARSPASSGILARSPAAEPPLQRSVSAASVQSPARDTPVARSLSQSPAANLSPAPAPTPAPTPVAARPSAPVASPTDAAVSRVAAQAEKLQLSAKAESALKVRNTTEIFSDNQTKHSKIFLALNPQPLAFQSARDRAEREETEQLGSVGVRSYFDATAASAPENESFDGFGGGDFGGGDDDDDDGEMEDPNHFDPHNLPDFGDFTEEMMQRRAARAVEEQKRRDQLAKSFAEKKAREKAEMDRELAEIQKREAEEAKKKQVADTFVVEAQKRIASELTFGSFVFK